MIKEFVEIWNKHKNELSDIYSKKHASSYFEIVKNVVTLLNNHLDGYGIIDPNRIHEIDDGDYQGTLLYVIACNDYQPSTYYSVFVDYGSCSGCDLLQSIWSDGVEDIVNETQLNDYMKLSLNIIQGLKLIPNRGVE